MFIRSRFNVEWVGATWLDSATSRVYKGSILYSILYLYVFDAGTTNTAFSVEISTLDITSRDIGARKRLHAS